MKTANSIKGWLAGFIDGEGYIGITYQLKRATRQSSQTPRYHPYLIVTNTKKEPLLFIQELIGAGKIYELPNPSHKHKASFQYKLAQMSILDDVLTTLIPHLRLKRKQAIIVKKFIAHRSIVIKHTGRGSRGSTSFDSTDAELYQQLLDLNHRGV